MNPPLHLTFRIASFLLASVLGTYCIWLLAAELARPTVNNLPTDRQSAAIATQQRVDASWAARVGIIRGDLWAESAFALDDLLLANANKNGSELTQSLGQVRGCLDRAVSYAPTQASVWLLLARLASHYHWPKPDPIEALRMSYYTGPNELPLMPLRSLMASQLPTTAVEMQQFARRDLRLLITHQQKLAVIQAYRSATPAGRRFIEHELGDSDPSFVKSLRGGAE